MTATTAKLTLADGSVEYLSVDDREILEQLVKKHTERSLSGAASFLDDVEFKAASGRVVTLREIRSVE